MKFLSPRQRKCLDFIRAHVKAHGCSPSFDEIRAHICVASLATVAKIIRALEEGGYVSRTPSIARSIEPLQTPDYHLPDCNCRGCAQARYIAQLKLIQGLKVQPPALVARARMDNIRLLDPVTRALLTGSAAPRTRTAIPTVAR
jgi:SOS-response transcriptional repressor LexA